MPILAGSYRCKSHDSRYTYEATWEEEKSTARWSAKIFDDGRLATASGAVKFIDDAGAAVRKRVEAYIEALTCPQARRGSCARKRAAASLERPSSTLE